MITEIIIVGVCLKVFIIAGLWVSTAGGFARAWQRVKDRCYFTEEKQTVYLTRGTIDRYESKFRASFEQLDQKLAEEEQSTPLDSDESSDCGLSYLRHFFTSLKKRINKKNKKTVQRKWNRKQKLPLLPSHNDPRPLEPESPDSCSQDVSFALDSESENYPTVPFSNQDTKSDFLNVKQFIQISESANRKKDELVKRTLGNHAKNATRPVPRSKLSLKLERKLSRLGLAISEAERVPKAHIISVKLDRLIRQHIRKSHSRGSTVLAEVPEEDRPPN